MTTLALVTVEKDLNITGMIEDLFDAYYRVYRIHRSYVDLDEPILLEEWKDWLTFLESSMGAIEGHLHKRGCFILIEGRAKNISFLSREQLELKILTTKIMP